MNNASFFSFTGAFFGAITASYVILMPLCDDLFLGTTMLVSALGASIFFFLFRRCHTCAPRVICIGLLGASVGLSVVSLYEKTHISPMLSPGTFISQKSVVSSLRSSYPGQAVRMRACINTSCSKRSRYLIEMKHFTDTRLSVGDVISVTGTVAKVEAFETESGTLFDYPRYLWKDAVAYRVNGKTVTREGTTRSLPLLFKRVLFKTHIMLVQSLKQIVSWKSSPLLSGILIGDGTLLSRETNTQFQKLGLSHILVLSGSNMTLIGSILYLFFRRTSLRTRSLLTIGTLTLFLVMAGIAPPALRAVIMVALFLFIKNTGRTGNGPRVLLLAALIMTALNPRILLYDVSFELSFLATAGLVFISPIILAVIPRNIPFRGVLSETLGAQIAVTPLILFFSATFSPYSLPLNLLVVPIIPFVMLSGSIGMILWWIVPTLGIWAAYPSDKAIQWIIWLADRASALPGSIITLPGLTLPLMLATYILLGIFVFAYHHFTHAADKEEGSGTLFA